MHKRLLALARDSRFGLTLTILAGFFAGLLTLWQALTLSNVINNVFLGGASLSDVWSLLRLSLIIIMGRALLSWMSDVSASAVAIHIKTELRERVFAHLLKLGPTYARGERTGELTSTAVEGIEALDAYYSQYLPQLVITALVPLSILLFVFPLDPLSGIVLLLTAPVIPVFMILIGKAAEALTKRQYETLSRLSAHFLDSLQGLTTLKQFGRSKGHAKTIGEVSDRFRDTTLSVLRVTFLSALVLEMVATISTAVVAVEVGLRLLYAKMAFQEAMFILIIAPEFYIPWRMLGLRFHAGMSGTTAAKRIFEILDLPVNRSDDFPDTVRQDRCSRPRTTEIATTPETLLFENVNYTYPDETAPALTNINLQINAGQHIALVGMSGAGKSTLANLLLRFIEPTSGQWIIDGRPSSQINPDVWRENIAWVPQKPYLFHETIAANICLAKPDASHEEMIAAARAANLHEFIISLPDGYDTAIGEGGARLSGGQAQRLALARAFLKNAPILILDEPTSSLDPEQETLLEDSVRRLMQDRTVITIAHRLNTVFTADQIIVLNSGHILEAGTHAELLSQNGAYAKLVKAHDVTESNVESQKSQVKEHSNEARSGFRPSALDQPSTNRSLPTFFRLLSFLNGAWSWVAGSVILGAVTIGASICLMGTSSWLISMAALHPSIAALEVAIVGVRFFGIARGVFRYLERLVSHNVTFRLLARLRTWFYTALEPLAPARLMEYRAGDLLARVIADVETLENFYVRVIAPPLVALIVTLGMSFFLGAFDPSLGFALFGFLFALGVLIPLATQLVSREPGRDLIEHRADLHTQLVDGVQGMPDLIAFGQQKNRQQKIIEIGINYGNIQRHMAYIAGFNNGLSVLMTNLGMWVVVALAIPLIIEGKIAGVMLATLALTASASFEAVTPLPLGAQMLGSSLEAAKRLFDVVDTKPAVVDTTTVGRLTNSAPGAIRFEDVRFSYGESDAALNGISFEVPAGASIAIVGPSGAGKSTIVNLLQRFWDYEHGEIRLDGQPLKSLAQDDVRWAMAVVAHSAYFFNAPIRQNLLIANTKARQEQIEAAARRAQIHNFIAGLPKGYETYIGEQGTRLSGGERQRLAIARALLKDAPLLILDEPTANLDPLIESAVLEVLWETMRGKTTLLITHRLVGLEHFDEIIVLDHGCIVERGRHADLLARDGLYRRMVDLQNRIMEK
jgi:ATP-binding cassette, subfamily C, bacterial CydCD